MRMRADQYIELIASSQKTALNGLSEIDQKGVQDSRAYIGMSKEGVRIALGYPAPHRTPSLKATGGFIGVTDGKHWLLILETIG